MQQSIFDTQKPKKSNLKFVGLEGNGNLLRFTIQHQNDSTCSVILKNKDDIPALYEKIDEKTMDLINDALCIWKNKVYAFAEQYIKDERKEIEFFNDVVTISKSLSLLPEKFLNLLNIGDSTTLFHNRIIAQIIESCYSKKLCLNLPPKQSEQKIHDFDINGLKCEVKTIQIIGQIEVNDAIGHRFKDNSYRSLVAKLKDVLEDAKKVGNKGIVFLAPWSYNINALLRAYYENQIVNSMPTLDINKTILVLTSDKVFENYYVEFDSNDAFQKLQNALSTIQDCGLHKIHRHFIRLGLIISQGSRKTEPEGFTLEFN